MLSRYMSERRTPLARITDSTGETVSTATPTVITFDTVDFDDFGLMGTNSLVMPWDGIYLVGANVLWSSNNTGYRLIRLLLNGSTGIAGSEISADSLSANPHQSVSTLYHFTRGQSVVLDATQNSGVDASILASSDRSPVLWAAFMGEI